MDMIRIGAHRGARSQVASSSLLSLHDRTEPVVRLVDDGSLRKGLCILTKDRTSLLK